MHHALFELIAPARCAECGARRRSAAHSETLCAACRAQLPWLALDGRCRLCQQELAIAPDARDTSAALCASCAARPSPLHACVALTAFEGASERWITRFKYPARGLAGLDPSPPAVLRTLARELAERARLRPADCLMPVPLHPARLRERGFNPPGLVARELGRALGVPVDYDALERVRDTPSQTGLSRAGRRRNVAGAFALRRPGAPLPARIWLVDDVVTTGATLREAAAVLRRGGVQRVVGLCIARTPSTSSPAEPSGRSALES